MEDKLIALWNGLLHRDDVGSESNFFDSGGDSMTLIRMLSTPPVVLDRRELEEFLAEPTVSKLAGLLRGSASRGV
jgi:hypothetical protein